MSDIGSRIIIGNVTGFFGGFTEMASYRKKGSSWEASVYCKGQRHSKSFKTKQEATHWAAAKEQEILSGIRGDIPKKTFGELLERYAESVSVHKAGARWEIARIKAICRDEISKVMLPDLKQNHFAAWRDRRLEVVSPGSVIREMNIVSHAINIAIKEWNWLRENPLSDIRRPKKPPARDRLLSEDEIERLLFALGYEYDEKPIAVSARVGAAMLFAIETAMRAGEIASLSWRYINLEDKTAHLPKTKNGTKRDVALSTEAIRILEQVRSENDLAFNLVTSQIDALFRKAKSRCGIDDLHFHDTRHSAITKLAGKLEILPLARMVGHRDLRQLQTYFNESAKEIAKRLN